MNDELTLAIIALIGVVVGYLVSHFLALRERGIIREFEMRKEGRGFYLPLYGHLANLADIVSAYVNAVADGKAQLIVEEGYKHLDPDSIVSRYKQAYEKFTESLYKTRIAGYELFIPDDIARLMEYVLAYSTVFYEGISWNFENSQYFVSYAELLMKRIEEVLGLRRKSLKERLLESRIVTFLRGY